MSHVKPTAEELEKQSQEAIDKLEKEEEVVVEDKEEEGNEEEQKEEEVVEDKKEEEVEKGSEEKEENQEEEDEKKEFPTEKEQLKESTRESQILHLKNKKLQEAIDQSAEIQPPTEEEMKQSYPDWDEMTAFEKKVATDTEHNNKRFAVLEGISKENKDIEAWNAKIDEFIDDPKTLKDYPNLISKTAQEKFKKFALKPSRRSLEMDDLVLAFTGELAKDREEVKKGDMFPKGGGAASDKEKQKDGKISVAESMVLMKNNYNEYKRLLQAGKIAFE